MNKSVKMRADNAYINYMMQHKWARNIKFKMDDKARATMQYQWIALKIAWGDLVQVIKNYLKKYE